MTVTAPAPVLPALQIGNQRIETPVVLAPMAGITNRAFRRLCRQYGDAGSDAAGVSGAGSLLHLVPTGIRAGERDVLVGAGAHQLRILEDEANPRIQL